MALQDLPVVNAQTQVAGTNGASPDGRRGAAHTRPRDAYRDVPILQRPPWNNDIAAYFYLGGISSGAFVLGALVEIVGGPRRARLARTAHYVSFVTMVPCPVLLIDDLGVPARFHHMLRIFKPSSPMNLGAWALTAHGGMATLAALRALAGDDLLPVADDVVRALPPQAVDAAGISSALTLGGYTGVLLGTSSVPVWYKSPLLGALFMASALSTGVAATSLAATLTGRHDPEDDPTVPQLSLGLGVSELALLGGYVATSGAAIKPLFRGREGVMVAGAIAVTAAGVALEAAGAVMPGQRRFLGALASGATLLGGALLRWSVIRAGHTSATDREGTLEAMKPSVSSPGWGP